jgi:hypothetical protein
MLYSHRGDAYRPTDAGYDIACYDAPNTNRQFTSVNEYFGNGVAGEEGAYEIACVDLGGRRIIKKSVYEYTGNAGNSNEDKPMSYEAAYNVTTHSLREEVAAGRVPGRQGPEEIYNASMVNATTNKAGPTQNFALSQRPMMSTKVYNSIPQPNHCAETKPKNIVPNKPIRNRLDANILDAYRSNPYTQSLHSYVF